MKTWRGYCWQGQGQRKDLNQGLISPLVCSSPLRGGVWVGVVFQKLRVVATGMPGSFLVRVDSVLKMPRGVSDFPIRW